MQPTSPDPVLACQKDAFQLPEGLHYLNGAYMSPLSKAVEAAGWEGMVRKRNPASITSADFFTDSHAVRASFARLVGAAAPEQIALIAAASYGIATVGRNLPLAAGQQIVVIQEQFPSNIYTWRRLAATTGAEVVTVAPPTDPRNRGERWNMLILEAITSRTAIVALPHVHWADGTLFDLEQIGLRARAVDAALVVDGTQSVGALPFDVQAIRPDALICAGYKWLLGPYSIGLAYFGPRFRDGTPLEENWIARKNSEAFSGLVAYQDEYQPGALRYDVGQRSNFILLPMMLAGLRLLEGWGIDNIQSYCRALFEDVSAVAENVGGTLEAPACRAAHLFGIRFTDPSRVGRLQHLLQERNVSVSIRGSAVRVSPNVYNDAADVASFYDALEHL